MLEAGADIWYVNISGETPLTEAALKGHLELVQWLLTVDGAGLDPNHKNSHGQTALFNAAYNGHKEVVQMLLENGADPAIRTTV
jgi:ankyrin repeat protein